MEKMPITRDGLEKLEKELRRLRVEERPAVIRAIADAREPGDLSENAEYHAAKERQSFVEGRLAELEDAISRATVVDTSGMAGDVVRFGAVVELAAEPSGDVASYRIVGSFEADASNGLLSITSPLGKALLGKTLGDIVEVNAPSGAKSFEVVNIHYE